MNALLHAFGHISEQISVEERRVFLAALQRFRLEQASVDGPMELLRAWNTRSRLAWLAGQTLLEPYPWELHLPGDSGGQAKSA